MNKRLAITSAVVAAGLTAYVALRTDVAPAPATFVDPPALTLEITPMGHHYNFQQATDVRGPWQTLFTRQNEYLGEKLRVTIYVTNTQMFYRSEVTL